MANLTVSIPHQLSRAEAKRRVEELTDQLREKSGGMLGLIETHWQEFVLDFHVLPMGQPVSGQISVEEQIVRIDVLLPWFLAALAGGVRQQIEQRGQHLLQRR